MDNQSNDSDRQHDITSSSNKKPNNRNSFSHKGICITSDFPGGNLRSVLFQQQFQISGKIALVVQFWGNSDAQSDPLDKSWFYFRITGLKDNQNIKYQQIIFRFKNGNNFRKFTRQKVYKPYVVVKQQIVGKSNTEWMSIFVSKINILQSQVIEAQFVYGVQPGINSAYFAQNLPYNIEDLQAMHKRLNEYFHNTRNSHVYYHREIISKSLDNHPTYLITLTSSQNISTYSEEQLSLFDLKDKRPYLMKNRPEILITARVHPSETASSYSAEGIIENLVQNSNFNILLHLFIFRIVPMINPDGVENGHYRLDNNLRNLNRFYGYSDPINTPTVYAVEKLIIYLREKAKLFMFIDIHGHNSPKPSFIFGNFSQNILQAVQNRAFVKVLQTLCEGNFDSSQCQFSKKNMLIKQKYDEHSKQASARVFAFRGYSQDKTTNSGTKPQIFVEHSYTLQIHPYIITNMKKNNKRQTNENSQKYLPSMVQGVSRYDQVIFKNYVSQQIIAQYKKISQNLLKAILQLVGFNMHILSQNQKTEFIRKRVYKDLSKLTQFYDKSKKLRSKQVHKQIVEKYLQRLKILQNYSQFINSIHIPISIKECSSKTLVHQIYEQQYMEKEEKNRRNRLIQKYCKEKKSEPNKQEAQLQHEVVQTKLSQQQYIEEKQKYQQFTMISYPPNTKQHQIGKLKKSNPLKPYQFEKNKMDKKTQTKQITQSNFIGFDIRNKGNNLMISQKNSSSSRNLQLQQIQRKIRKLIFRHKTEAHLQFEQQICHQAPVIQNVFYKSEQNLQTQLKNNSEIKSKNINNIKTLNNQKIKNKVITHIKTLQNNLQVDFNDRKLIIEKQKQSSIGISEKVKNSEKYKINPRVLQFSKKIENKQKLQTIIYENSKYEQVKLSTITDRRNKSLSRNEQTKHGGELKYKIFQISDNTNNSRGIKSIMTLPPMALNSLQINPINAPNFAQKNRNNLKNQVAKNEQQNSTQIKQKIATAMAMEISNRQGYIQKAKRMVSEKKVEAKITEETNLPIISQIQCIYKNGQRKYQ